MEESKKIQYVLIGNLATGKIISEISYTINPKYIYEINEIFNSYSKMKYIKPIISKIDSYNVFISIDKIIMITKADKKFPVSKNLELFQKITKELPNLLKQNLGASISQNFMNSKIKEIIDDFIKANTRISKNVFFNMKIKQIKRNVTNDDSKRNLEAKNSIYSFTTMNKKKEIEKNNLQKNNLIDENSNIELNKANIINQLYNQSNIIINRENIYNLSKNCKSSKTNYTYLAELIKVIWRIKCCKRCIIFILVFIILSQIVIIPFVIKCSYSY